MAHKVSEAESLTDLKRVADELGHPPTTDEYREHGQYSCPTVAKHFDGSFTAARAEALNCPNERQPEHRRKKLLSDIQRVAEQVGHEPSKGDYEDHGEYALSTITYRFDTWIAAKKEAGVYEGLDESPSKEELLNDMQRVDEELDEPLSQKRYNEHGEWTPRPVKRRFDSWEVACQKASVSRPEMGPQPVSDEAMLEDIQAIAEQLGHVPSRSQYNEHGQFSRGMAKERFGSWPDAVEAAGLDALDPGGPPGVHNGHWADVEPYYGPNWDECAEKIRERDDYECQNCGMSNVEHVEKFGSKLNVHHIKKARKFDSYDAANAQENLITLCNSCHSTYEHLPSGRAKELLGMD